MTTGVLLFLPFDFQSRNMKVGGVFISVVWMFSRCNSIAVSSIDCGDTCAAITGSSYTLTCRWSGALQSGIVWKRGGTSVMLCILTPDGGCIPSPLGYANGSYVNSQTAEMKITSFSNADADDWECSDGSEASQSCTLTPIAPRTINLEASCTRVEIGHAVTCKLDDHGIPAITLEMRDDNVIESTTTAGLLTKTISGAGMKTYTCAVTGQGSECATPKLKTTTCDDGDIGLPIGVMVVIITLVAIVIVLLVLLINGTMTNRIAFYVSDAILIITAVVFIILLFVLSNDYADGLFIAAVVIVILGGIVGILAVIIQHVLHVN